MTRESQEMGELMTKSHADALFRVQNVHAQPDAPLIEVRDSSGCPETSPLNPWSNWQGMVDEKFLKYLLSVEPKFIGNAQNPGALIIPPEPMSLAMLNHFGVSYFEHNSASNPSDFPPA